MATITLLWHLHQPAYRTADGIARAPWVAVHAGGSYTTLARAILESGARGHVLNLVPTLVEQMEAYRDGRVHDPVVDVLCRPVAELGDDDVGTLLDWAFHVPHRQLHRYRRLAELADRRRAAGKPDRVRALFGRGDLRDLQVLFILAHAGDQAWLDPELAPLADKGRHFDPGEHAAAAAWLYAQPGRILDLWRRLAGAEGVEIATSPYAHPIMPLLVDTGVVAASWAPAEPPRVPAFRHPEDARRQLAEALDFMRSRGYGPLGCWPPEGSVSAEALSIYAEAGVRWLVTDEGILERSLGRSLRADGRTPEELYRPWRLAGGGPVLFFRDRMLSDRIGFVYGGWEDEERAAADLLAHLEAVARALPEEAAIVLALDGENPWLHYARAGGGFLRALAERIEAANGLRPATLAELAGSLPCGELESLHPGSWIGGTFATWIGHPEKSAGWELLSRIRERVGGSGEIPPSMLLAEGSDWFWWLGDDNPTPLAPLYDEIFRRHLADACLQAGQAPPAILRKPLKVRAEPVRVPVSRHWRAPVLDGRITSYFEWSLAEWRELSPERALRRLGLWSDGARLFVAVEGREPMGELLAARDLTVRLTGPSGEEIEVGLGPGGVRGSEGAGGAVDRIAEASLPWPAGPNWRLEIEHGDQHYPERSVLVLAPFEVDEEPASDEEA